MPHKPYSMVSLKYYMFKIDENQVRISGSVDRCNGHVY